MSNRKPPRDSGKGGPGQGGKGGQRSPARGAGGGPRPGGVGKPGAAKRGATNKAAASTNPAEKRAQTAKGKATARPLVRKPANVQDKTAPDQPERIAKRIARAGVASRRDAERLIEAGRVSLNGKRLDTPAVTVTAADRIVVDGVELGAPEPPRMWRYHKPTGLVTTARDEKGRRTVFDALPPEMPRVVSIGRLDLNSEGLLLLTNDGDLKRRLELPETGWLRKYRVRAHGEATETALERLRAGMTIDGERFKPMSVTLDRQQGANAWLTVGLREGRNREIRRAMEEIGLEVSRLIRISYGPFRLDELQRGAVEEIRSKVLADQLGLKRELGRVRPTRTKGST